MYESLPHTTTIEGSDEIRSHSKIGNNPNWKCYVLLQMVLWYIALSPYDIAKGVGYFSVGLCLLAAFFARVEYAVFGIISCICLGPWLTKSLIEFRIPTGNIQTIFALIGLFRFLPHFMRLKTDRFAKIIGIGIVLLILSDAVNALRGYMPPDFITLSGHYVRFISVLVCMYAAGDYFDEKEAHLFSVAVLGAVYVLGASIASSTLSFDATTLSELSDARSSGQTDPNYALTGTVFWLIAALSFMMRSDIRKLTKFVLGIAFFYGVYFVGIGSSRTATVALCAGVMILLLTVKNRRIQMAVLVFCCMLTVWSLLPEVYRIRIAAEEGGRISNRLPAYENAYEEFLKAPIFGSGHSTYYKKWNALTNLGSHNTILHLLAEGGIITAGIYLLSMILLFRFGWQRLRQNRGLYAAFFLALLLSYFIASHGLILHFFGNQIGLIFSAIVALTLGYFKRTES